MKENKEKCDTVEKEFITFPDIAADVINVLLYQGKGRVSAENLLSGPTETIYQGSRILRSQYEDLCKYELTEGRIKMMYLIANQSRTDGKMLLRKAGYTGGIYREQYERKMQELFPVIEFVLYWGRPKWQSGRDIRRLFKEQEISDEEWKYIDELKLYIFEMRRLPEETRKLFQSDMRIVVDFLAEGSGYKSNRKIRHKAALIKMINVLSGNTEMPDVEKWLEKQGIKEEDEVMWCEIFEQYVRQGRTEGRAEGETRFARLVEMLMEVGRTEDVRRAASDKNYREKLYREADF